MPCASGVAQQCHAVMMQEEPLDLLQQSHLCTHGCVRLDSFAKASMCKSNGSLAAVHERCKAVVDLFSGMFWCICSNLLHAQAPEENTTGAT